MNKNEKFVITINRELGSGGRTVGRLLAEKLGVPFYDKAVQFLPNNRAVEVDIEADGTVTPDGDAFEYKIENGKLYMLELDHPEDGWESFGTINISGNTFELTSESGKSTSTRKEVKLKRYKKIS